MKLEEIYKKGTAKQLWNDGWDVTQRTHFLIDHYDAFGTDLDSDVNKYAQKFSHSAWKDLPKAIQMQVAIHHAMGIYIDGGKINRGKKGLIKSLEDTGFISKLNQGEQAFQEKMAKRDAFEKFISQPFQEKFNTEYRPEYERMYSGERKKFVQDKRAEFESTYKADGGKIKPPMKYLTTDKKKLLAGITTIKQRAAKVKDEKTLAALNDHLKKMEDLLNAPKLPASEKISRWKGDKAARRMGRKMA